jgi:hypothetical protein
MGGFSEESEDKGMIEDLDPQKVDTLALVALCALGDPEAITERGHVGKGDTARAIKLLRQLRKDLRGPERPESKKKYQMLLSSVGNPDFGQWAPVSDPEWVEGDTLREMRKHAEEYQQEHNLGGGNWTHPEVLEGDKVIGNFAYNMVFYEGKWKSKDWKSNKEIKI